LIAFLDTNILIRHLTGDPPRQARRATTFLRDAEILLLTDVVIAEAIYVLESFYEVDRAQIARVMRATITYKAIRTIAPSALLRSLEVYERHGLDYAEAYLVALAESTGVDRVASFDKAIDRVKSVERVAP
jgi:predicted nucleic acid-binding protein